MRFVCENCLAQYMIKDEKLRPQGVKVRCKKCSHIMTIRPPESDFELADEATIRMPFPEEEESDSFFADVLGQSGEIPSPSLSIFEEDGPTATSRLASSPAGFFPKSSDEGVSPPTPAASDLGSLFDDPELKSPSGGLFGSLDDEELGDAFERAISQRQTPSLQPAPSGLSSEPSIVVSQGLSQTANAEWFVAIDDNQTGPLDLEGIKSHWQQGRIDRDSLCWKSGMRDWEPIGAVEGLFEELNIPSEAAPSPAEFSSSAADWQPSAASALASLVQDELQGLSAAPPPLSGVVSGAEAVPYAATAAAVSEIPLASNTLPPAPAYISAISPASQRTSPSAIYLPPVSPPAKIHRAVWVAAGLLVVCGFLVGAVVFMGGSKTPQPPPAVAQTPPPVPAPPPAAAPPAVVTPTPPPPPPPPTQESPQTDSSQALAQQLLPPKTPRPERRTSERRPAKSDVVATAPTPGRSSSRVQDDFDKTFGTSSDSSRSTARSERQTTVYVPPAPGAGAAKQALSDADIMEYILSRRAEVAACAKEQRVKDSKVKGNMVVEWNIATSGKTSQVRLVTPSNFQGTHFASCVTKLIQTWQFPAHRTAGGTRKFNFKI